MSCARDCVRYGRGLTRRIDGGRFTNRPYGVLQRHSGSRCVGLRVQVVAVGVLVACQGYLVRKVLAGVFKQSVIASWYIGIRSGS